MSHRHEPCRLSRVRCHLTLSHSRLVRGQRVTTVRRCQVVASTPLPPRPAPYRIIEQAAEATTPHRSCVATPLCTGPLHLAPARAGTVHADSTVDACWPAAERSLQRASLRAETGAARGALAVRRGRHEEFDRFVRKVCLDLLAVLIEVDDKLELRLVRPIFDDERRVPLRHAVLVQKGGVHALADEGRIVPQALRLQEPILLGCWP